MSRDPEKVRDYNRRYREQNRERLLAYGAAYREKNRVQLREWHRENQQKNTVRKRLAPYDLTEEEFKRMLEDQNGRCLICNLRPSGKGPNAVLHIDHCHETGKVRGLLCQACNRGLGFFRDDPARLTAAVDYLRTS